MITAKDWQQKTVRHTLCLWQLATDLEEKKDFIRRQEKRKRAMGYAIGQAIRNPINCTTPPEGF